MKAPFGQWGHRNGRRDVHAVPFESLRMHERNDGRRLLPNLQSRVCSLVDLLFLLAIKPENNCNSSVLCPEITDAELRT